LSNKKHADHNRLTGTYGATNLALKAAFTRDM